MKDLALLREKMDRQPFRSFVIEFASGSQILVYADSEMLFPRRRPELAIAFTNSGTMHEFEASAIVRLVELT